MSDILDGPSSLFLMCAAVAWAEVAAGTGQWPPDNEMTRRRAYAISEAELAAESGG